MTRIIQGNIFDSDCEYLVNTINCVGFMGKGIALEFSIRYPEMEVEYQKFCATGQIAIGKLWAYTPPTGGHKILNFPTKLDYRYPTKEAYIRAGLENFVATYERRGISSIAFPILGGANGKFPPERAIAIMREYLEPLPITVEIYQSVQNERDADFADFIKRLQNVPRPTAKQRELAEYLAAHPSITNFAQITTAKVSCLRPDGTTSAKTLATKPYLQKLVLELSDTPGMLSGQATLNL